MTFLPGLPLTSLTDVKEKQLYHLPCKDGDAATIQLDGNVWRWRKLKGDGYGEGGRTQLEEWLKAQR